MKQFDQFDVIDAEGKCPYIVAALDDLVRHDPRVTGPRKDKPIEKTCYQVYFCGRLYRLYVRRRNEEGFIRVKGKEIRIFDPDRVPYKGN